MLLALVALREPRLRQLATLAYGLSPETVDAVTDMVRRARQIEGLDGAKPARDRKAP